jgi:hypothetical protein
LGKKLAYPMWDVHEKRFLGRKITKFPPFFNINVKVAPVVELSPRNQGKEGGVRSTLFVRPLQKILVYSDNFSFQNLGISV